MYLPCELIHTRTRGVLEPIWYKSFWVEIKVNMIAILLACFIIHEHQILST